MVPRPYTVGIGFELARSESIRPEIHDIALDVVVTDAGVFYTPSSQENCIIVSDSEHGSES
jgi:hypothetical protein